MRKELKITFKWDLESIEEVSEDVKEYLEEEAKDRIFEMMKEGYVSGELCSQINDDSVWGNWWVDIKNLD
jgi:hypothetical protein